MSCWRKCATAVAEGVSEIQEIKELILKHQKAIDELLALVKTLTSTTPAIVKEVEKIIEGQPNPPAQ